MALDGGELLELLCPICYGEQNDSGYATLVCGHVFHTSCLERSLKVKKECPSCRCPARPIEHGRRDGVAQPRCPCKTGQPVRLYHLQRPRHGTEGATQAGAGGGDTGGLDAAALAAAEQRAAQRENRLREALQEERRRVTELELEVARQETEVTKALEKAERRKQRLATMEKEHQAATTRLVEDKSRLEAREREQSEELCRMRQALHNTRMDLEKTRALLYEREEAVMRLKREVAMQRARAGGTATLQPREMEELLGERKEDWQMVYSLKVEELRRANDAAAELKAALARSATDADARVAAERLAGAERVKAITLERDVAKRELMDLEYKLHQAERRLAELQPQPTLLQTRHHSGVSVGANAARPEHDSRRGALAPPSAVLRNPAPALTSRSDGLQRQQEQKQQRQQQQQHGQDPEEDDDELELLALIAMGCPQSQDPEDGHDDPRDGDLRVQGGGPEASVKRGRGTGGSAAEGGHGSSGLGRADPALEEEEDDGNFEYDATPYDVGGEESQQQQPSSKRQRSGPPGSSIGGGSLANDLDAGVPFDVDMDDDPDPVPALPRAFSGLISDDRSGGQASSQHAAVSGAGGLAAGAAARHPLGGAACGPSFASKATLGPGVTQRIGGGSSLIVDGPDGRGGTTRFPLTSSFAHNGLRFTSGSGKASRGGGGGGRGSGGAKQAVAASGRIDAFLRPLQPANRR